MNNKDTILVLKWQSLECVYLNVFDLLYKYFEIPLKLMRLMKSKIFIMVIFFLGIVLSVDAARIDTLYVRSNSMNKDIPVVSVLPEGYTSTKKYPVVYMLHGYSDSYRNSYLRDGSPAVKWADALGLILIVPDGGFSSWYFDSPVDPTYKYETFVSRELVEYVDNEYSTVQSPYGRAITGYSMGGHGAFYLAFRNQDIFGAAGSMSGGVDIRPFPLNWDMAKRLGEQAEHPENWEKNTVINMTHLLTSKSLAIIFDCGTEDFFYEVNCRLHEKLLYMNIPHEFISRPGGHNWTYWSNSVNNHLLFFHSFFQSANK